MESIIDKSLYHYFNAKINELEEKNIFKKTKPTNFTKEELAEGKLLRKGKKTYMKVVFKS